MLTKIWKHKKIAIAAILLSVAALQLTPPYIWTKTSIAGSIVLVDPLG
jgi:hypothetical protein